MNCSSGDRPISSLPTFVRTAYNEYVSRKDLPDYYARYRALECVYAATIKHIGTTFALIAADRDPNLRDQVWGKIFESSGLGGWLDATDVVCSKSRSMPEATKAYCNDYSDYRSHPSRATLDGIADRIASIVKEFTKRGYKIEQPKSLNIIRTLRYITTIRNKCAHGALDEFFFSRIEDDLVAVLKSLLRLIPFSRFVFWGRLGGNALEFLDYPPRQRPAKRACHFWAESGLLLGGFAEQIPFLVYKQDSRTIYFLNDSATDEEPHAEYIDYVTGQVTYRTIEYQWPHTRSRIYKPVNVVQYKEYVATLSRVNLSWRDVPLSKVAIDSCVGEVGVYMFTTTVSLGGRPADVVLYVGKTTNLSDRLASYLRIKKGYDDTRSAISDMFASYEEAVRLSFAPVSANELASVERAIYETMIPAYNMIAPPAGKLERT